MQRRGDLARGCVRKLNIACRLERARDLDAELRDHLVIRRHGWWYTKTLWPPAHRPSFARRNAHT